MPEFYILKSEPQFMDDCPLIHPDQRVIDQALESVTKALERKPEVFPVFDQERNLRIATILFHVFAGPSAIHVEPTYVTFRIESPKPNGLVSLRRIVTRADVLGGLHVGTSDLPRAADLPPADDYWPSS